MLDTITNPQTALGVRPHRRDSARSLATALAVATPAAALAVMGYRYRWLADDGDIAMRVVRQILAGHGPVFNVGERVEVSTSALWVWLLAAIAFVSRLGVYQVALLTSLLLAPAGLLLAADGTRRLLGGGRHRAGSSRPGAWWWRHSPRSGSSPPRAWSRR